MTPLTTFAQEVAAGAYKPEELRERALAALEGTDAMQGWRTIDSAPKGREMFVVKAFNVKPGFSDERTYTSDPWCVWRCLDGGFARWPHPFFPTHWTPLPEAPPPPVLPDRSET